MSHQQPLLSPARVQFAQDFVTTQLQPALALISGSPDQLDPSTFTSLPSLIQTIQHLIATYTRLSNLIPEELHSYTLHQLDQTCELLIELENRGPLPSSISKPPTLRTHSGRTAYDISRATLETLVKEGHSNQGMADLLGVSRGTIMRRRRVLGLGKPKMVLSDAEAEGVIRELIKDGHEDMGEVGMRAALTVRNIHLPRRQLRKGMFIVRGNGVRRRWLKAIKRRRYSVPFPNSLWHMDGHHKLIRWGIVTHGGIDGKTRLVVFLRASTNNKAETVFASLHQAVKKHGWPSRIRGDHGGENMLVKEAIEMVRGIGRGSFLQGRSVHNQRIERLWRDVCSWKIANFKAHFESLELEGRLNPIDEVDLWSLHFIYMPLVNRALDDFVEEWNYHKLRTERFSPVALFRRGILQARRAGFDVLASPFRQGVGEQDANGGGAQAFVEYGNIHGQSRVRREDDPYIQVPQVSTFLTMEEIDALSAGLGERPNGVDMEWGRKAYLYVREHCRSFVRSRNAE